ncbi:MAG: HEAT repeat domain-containing protein [Planctomycetota bacterium]
MKRLLLAACALALLALALPELASGHGGQYRGPGDTVPPNLGGGGDTTPPGNPGGPGTPGPGAGPQTGMRGGSSGTGPAVPGGGQGRGRGARTGGFSKRGSGEGFEQWEFWWEYNKEPYLDLRNRLKDRGAQSGSVGHHLGTGTAAAATSNRTTPEDFKNLMLPVLKEALKESDADVVDSAVLAIARSLPAEEADLAFNDIVATLAHPQDSAKQSAALSLGVLGSEKARPILLELMRDSQAGRNSLGSTREVPPMIRGFAALSLGMIGKAEDVQVIMDVINNAPDSDKDLKSCALLALGMFKEKQGDIIPFLINVIGRSQMDRMLRSLAPISLAKMNKADAYLAALGQLLATARDDKTDNDMIRSCVIALGKLANMSDDQVLSTLYTIIKEHSDAQARHWSYIALAQIASRDQESYAANEKAHEQLLAVLLNDLMRPEKKMHQPWAALALAIYAREYRSIDERAQLVSQVIQKLIDAFKETNNPSYQGAIAIALGLMNAKDAAADLFSVLESSHHHGLRGYIAVALGLMGHIEAAPNLRAMIGQKGLEWRFRLNLARGLGLMNDVQSLDTLISLIQESTTISETASLAQAIGLIGEKRAIEPLIQILKDKGRPGQLRGFCAVALGLLAEKTLWPWNAAVSVDLNYRSKTDSISEVLDIL